MGAITLNRTITKFTSKIDLSLLVFLVLFLDVKLIVKLVALIFIYILYPNLRTGFGTRYSRLPLFYPAIIVIAVINYFIFSYYSKINYSPVLFTGVIFWLACILASHQVKLAVERNTIQVLENTLLVFFVLNAFVSISNIILIIFETGAINPYRYQGQYQKYFIGTGDYIKGITFDTSTTNAIINSFGVVYFLHKKKEWMVLICMGVLLLTGSNFTNIILVAGFVLLFLFRSDKNQKSILVTCCLLIIVFMGKISPQNDDYISDTFNKYILHKPSSLIAKVKSISPIKSPDSIPASEERKRKVALHTFDSLDKVTVLLSTLPAVVTKPEIPTPSIHSKPFQHIADTTFLQRQLLVFMEKHRSLLPISSGNYGSLPQPGKIIALNQTVNFLLQHPLKIMTGEGVGNFSSKLAFRATALDIAGGYPSGIRYINSDFMTNHLDVYLYYFTKNAGSHSLINNTGSVYDQILSEYGIIGILIFFIFYIWFFLKRYKVLSYGLPVLFLLLCAFFVEYWFEQLSIVILAELLLYMDLKQIKSLDNAQ